MGENPGDPTEWVTEGVQVGGPGSAMGVLGFWTGSQHEKMDPLGDCFPLLALWIECSRCRLGPCWAWKVG